ncbi:MAG: condensation domain-containing protein, partial [candidate division KSB1 bacterium]|nr:condensation domain-containing protein [candidate division KSB1 bacterium]
MQSENIQDMYPLSPMQQGMLFHSLYTPGTGVYIEQLSCHLRGQLNVAAFEQSWQTLVDRHPVLRTAFLWEDLDEPLQIVHKQVTIGLRRLDWRHLSPEMQAQQLQELIDEEKKEGFDLSEAPLMRLTLIQEADDLHRFIWIHHHILFDGWSLPLLLDEVFAIYEALSRRQPFTREPSRPYRDYIAWLQEQDLDRAEKFWRAALTGFQSPNQIPLDRFAGRALTELDEYTTERLLLSPDLSKALQDFSRQYQLTLSTMLQAAWALLLGYYSGDDDVVYGSIVSGRPVDLSGSEAMLGLFINTLPVRVKIDSQATLLSWLQAFQLQLSELRQFEYCSLIQIQGWSEVPRDLPLFHSILVFENYPLGEAITEKKGSLQIQDIESYSRTNYPLTFVVSPGKQIGLEIAYEKQRYESDTIQRMLRHLQQLLESFVADPEQ